MLKLIVLIYISTFANLASSADFFTELQATRNATLSKDQVNLGFFGGEKTLGYWGYGQVANSGYEEVYAGPRIMFNKWLEAGVAIGVERAAKSDWMERYGAYVRLAGEQFSLTGAYEDGGTGRWHKVLMSYRFMPQLSVGIQNQTFYGTGPQAEYFLTKSVSVLGARLQDSGGPTWLFTLKTRF